jgi:ribonuclease HI
MEINIYTDGSVDAKKHEVYWGFVAVDNEKEIYREKGVLTGEVFTMRQVGGEIAGVIKGVLWCKKMGYKGNIYFDFINLYKWVADQFSNDNPWNANNIWSQRYRQFIIEHRPLINKFEWVKAHDTNKWNNEVDKMLQ